MVVNLSHTRAQEQREDSQNYNEKQRNLLEERDPCRDLSHADQREEECRRGGRRGLFPAFGPLVTAHKSRNEEISCDLRTGRRPIKEFFRSFLMGDMDRRRRLSPFGRTEAPADRPLKTTIL